MVSLIKVDAKNVKGTIIHVLLVRRILKADYSPWDNRVTGPKVRI